MFTLMKYNDTKIPKSMILEINKTISRHNHPNFIKSIGFLLRDVFISYAIYSLYHFIKHTFNINLNVFSYFLYIVYSIALGTSLTGIWVLGHECGHGAFGQTKWQNDMVGFITHSALLVPYFSWQYSHNKHHKYTNHLVNGETHVPSTKKGMEGLLKVRDILGDEAFLFIHSTTTILLGWPLYLFFYSSGGRTGYDIEKKLNKSKPVDHFRPWSQIIHPRLYWKVVLSTVGCLSTCGLIWYNNMIVDYIGPYLVVNSWLIIYTLLQHTSSAVPHYGVGTESIYNHTLGALCTIDRPYPWLIDQLHHHIGTTHVIHHLNYSVPHYHAEKCTKEMKLVLGDRYLYDSTPILTALKRVFSDCIYVDSIEGIQYFKK